MVNLILIFVSLEHNTKILNLRYSPKQYISDRDMKVETHISIFHM